MIDYCEIGLNMSLVKVLLVLSGCCPASLVPIIARFQGMILSCETLWGDRQMWHYIGVIR